MKFILFASLLLVVVQAFPLNKRGTGASISVNSSQDFCSYLPPGPGKSVSATERDATPFCTNSTTYADAFPPGFIKSAHFLRTPTYVQVTGRINHTVYDILVEDGGGQYDVKNLPQGTCNGLKHWVNLIEPDSEQFCIRCCQIKTDCNIGLSTYGCRRIVPGDYS
ncbi:uncharacterized protein EV154DRAFT_65744 [Mucor mucedo]|uniref:uncharacterized protein n=1 Tax=Mucor mucedo TaxID=29922 RepID=UPI0022205F04|nr:uncharacterized protein EV154DRAFT_65744 [Mucor mucedo]KAI7876473.1 hypothetical protein EV154DRAFT_65744 [Mucor mucedo]